MESRRIVHYTGNSIKPRKVSMPSIMKRMRQEGVGMAEDTNYHIPIIDKVYATKNCVWCPMDFENFRIVCNSCRNCQYCGMASSSAAICNICGNRMPEELKSEVATDNKKIRFL